MIYTLVGEADFCVLAGEDVIPVQAREAFGDHAVNFPIHLTPAVVNEFIKMVIVHAPTKINGRRSRFVQVVYNLVGEVTIPGSTDSKTA